MKIIGRVAQRIVAWMALVMHACLMIESIYLLYCYHFTDALYVVMFPDSSLVLCAVLGGIGIGLSLLLWKEKLSFKLFLISMLIIGFMYWKNLIYPAYIGAGIGLFFLIFLLSLFFLIRSSK